MNISVKDIQRIAGLELNGLRAAGVLGDEYERVSVPSWGTPVYDVNGSILFYRLPLSRDTVSMGYVDIGADDALGEPLLATSLGLEWNQEKLEETGRAKAQEIRRGLKYDRVRFVAYSFPKLALQFLLEEEEALMLELFSWEPVPQVNEQDRKPLEHYNFERWSLLDELPTEMRDTRTRNFDKRLKFWEDPLFEEIDPRVVTHEVLRATDLVIELVDSREIHYSQDNSDHFPCYELHSQQTSVWCVAASVEMVLNFYRYSYDQIRLVQELGLGTLQNPNGLPYGQEGAVVTVMENLTSNSLDVTMHTNPDWNIFRHEILANRPVISFVPRHSRTVAGYTSSLLAIVNQLPFRGLLVYDPWPPNVGTITRWENFATQNYLFAFSSGLQHV